MTALDPVVRVIAEGLTLEPITDDDLRRYDPEFAQWNDDLDPPGVCAIEAASKAVAALSAAGYRIVKDDDNTQEHYEDWAVLSDDGEIYSVHDGTRERAEHEAALLRETEPNAKAIRRRRCNWAEDTVWDLPDDSPEADPDRLAAVIEQVRALCEEAKAAAAAYRAETGAYCADEVDADDVLALLPPATWPTQEAT